MNMISYQQLPHWSFCWYPVQSC